MASFEIKLWKLSPFVRLVLPLIFGIIFQYYFQISSSFILVLSSVLLILMIAFSKTSISKKYQYRHLQGVFIMKLIFVLGMFLTANKNITLNNNWFGNNYSDSSILLIKINEPVIEKENSFKTIGNVLQITNGTESKNVIGQVLIYFSKKDSNITVPLFGDCILLKGGLQKIKNAGNPGGFDYKRYMEFQQIRDQAFLKTNDFEITNYNSSNFLYNFIYTARAKVLTIIKQNIKADHNITGIVEALLIGYKEDLDKDLVQAYSNTGVVHIIAISGMHLGLIYVGLVWLFARLPYIKRSKIAQLVLILTSMWLFSLITGASASVLRSAVMFTCILVGKTFFTRTSIYNSLATSAFLLLCYNPFILWDVGFQLSYTAVIGIVWLQKPIENIYYSKFWAVRNIWKMCSITIAAQVLTLPLCIYYFHQIPIMFLFTNLICVPLSTIILFSEILLIVVASISPLALFVGKIIYFLTWLMNVIISFFNNLPFSLIDTIHSTLLTTIFLYAFVILLCKTLLRKRKASFILSLSLLILFLVTWSFDKIVLAKQQKLIVYNVSKHKAIDFISQNKYTFYGDDELKIDGALQNFNLKPSRVFFQANFKNNKLINNTGNKLIAFKNKQILFIEDEINQIQTISKTKVDAVVLSKNAPIKIETIVANFMPETIVIDGSNSLWKITQWKTSCEELHLQLHITSEKGAFILDAN